MRCPGEHQAGALLIEVVVLAEEVGVIIQGCIFRVRLDFSRRLYNRRLEKNQNLSREIESRK